MNVREESKVKTCPLSIPAYAPESVRVRVILKKVSKILVYAF